MGKLLIAYFSSTMLYSATGGKVGKTELALISSGGLMLLLSCAPAARATPSTIPKPADCPNLESRLYQLATAPDPADFASRNGLSYNDGAVRVVIELTGKDQDLLKGYSINVEMRSNDTVQASVGVKDLCKLSNEPQVKSIRVPFKPIPSKR